MNTGLMTPEPLTDLGRLLVGSQGEGNLKLLTKALTEEEFRVKAAMSKGMSESEYAYASRRITALQYANATVKSLQLFLSP